MNMFNVLTSASKVFAAFLGLGVMFLFLTIAIAVILALNILPSLLDNISFIYHLLF